jgi:hypothetical protein
MGVTYMLGFARSDIVEAKSQAYLMRSMSRGSYYAMGRRIGAVDPSTQYPIGRRIGALDPTTQCMGLRIGVEDPTTQWAG